MTEDEEKLFFTIGDPQQDLKDVVLFALTTGARKGKSLNLKNPGRHLFLIFPIPSFFLFSDLGVNFYEIILVNIF